MEQEPGAASFISLSEPEQRCYSGLHSLCQADTSGKLSSGKVAELFKASQLPPESLHKVSTAAHPRLSGCIQLTATCVRTCRTEQAALFCALWIFYTRLCFHIFREGLYSQCVGKVHLTQSQDLLLHNLLYLKVLLPSC